MRRREFATGTLLALAAPAVAQPQQMVKPVVGWLGAFPPSESIPQSVNMAAFKSSFREAGFIEGKNVTFEYRWAAGHNDRFPVLAGEFVAEPVDLIVAAGGTSSAVAAKNATLTIPVVFAAIGDPVGSGLVASLAHPGGNVTGTSNLLGDLMSKFFELMSELVPQAATIGLITNPSNPSNDLAVGLLQQVTAANGKQVVVAKARVADELDAAFASLASARVGALIIAGDALFFTQSDRLAQLTLHYRLPAMLASRDFIRAGGLIAYGQNNQEAAFRQAGVYAGRILKGEKPSDLPVQQPTKFELMVNLRTAKTLGITIPTSILVRVDEVVE